MTARELYDRLAAAGVSLTAEGEKLFGTGILPAELVDYVSVLGTGLRAIVTGRQWYGMRSTDGRAEPILVNVLLPEGIDLLSVADDAKWDCVRLELPDVYQRDTNAEKEATTEQATGVRFSPLDSFPLIGQGCSLSITGITA